MEKLKIQCFEYLLYKLLEWNGEAGNDSNDISILKSLKLLFFVSAVKAEKDRDDSILDTVFNHYVAMPYGHVESDIYDIIKKNELRTFTLTTHSCEKIQDAEIDTAFDNDIRLKIDEAIEALKHINSDLIKYDSFTLVELCHSWYSWKYYFSLAKRTGIRSTMIPIEVIKSEEKIFTV